MMTQLGQAGAGVTLWSTTRFRRTYHAALAARRHGVPDAPAGTILYQWPRRTGLLHWSGTRSQAAACTYCCASTPHAVMPHHVCAMTDEQPPHVQSVVAAMAAPPWATDCVAGDSSSTISTISTTVPARTGCLFHLSVPIVFGSCLIIMLPISTACRLVHRVLPIGWPDVFTPSGRPLLTLRCVVRA